MIEIGLMLSACLGMGKIADADGRSGFVWGLITLAVCLASLAIPLPLIRVVIAGVVVFILMMIAKSRDRR